MNKKTTNSQKSEYKTANFVSKRIKMSEKTTNSQKMSIKLQIYCQNA